MRAALPYLLVGVGGFLGANARYVLARWVGELVDTRFPLATLVVNVSGCFALGVLATLVLARLVAYSDEVRLAVGVGFLGAFTTFSTFGYETHALVEDGTWVAVLLNVAASVVIGLLARRASSWPARGAREARVALLDVRAPRVLAGCCVIDRHGAVRRSGRPSSAPPSTRCSSSRRPNERRGRARLLARGLGPRLQPRQVLVGPAATLTYGLRTRTGRIQARRSSPGTRVPCRLESSTAPSRGHAGRGHARRTLRRCVRG